VAFLPQKAIRSCGIPAAESHQELPYSCRRKGRQEWRRSYKRQKNSCYAEGNSKGFPLAVLNRAQHICHLRETQRIPQGVETHNYASPKIHDSRNLRSYVLYKEKMYFCLCKK